MRSPQTNLKILWMIPKWTLPATDGARVATDSLIRNTIKAGALVDVLCLPQESEITDPEFMRQSWDVQNIFILPRSLPEGGWQKKIYYLKQLLLRPFMPLTFSSFAETKNKKYVKEIVSKGYYDFILLDGLHLGVLFLNGLELSELPPKTKLIYRAHNIEFDLWQKAYQESRNPFIKLALYFQSLLIRKFESSIINQSHGVAAISAEDLVSLSAISSTETALIPLGLNFAQSLSPHENKSVKFLFIGRLDWPPNRDGLEWILNEVWPSVVKSRPEATLKIVGSGNSQWLKDYQRIPGLEIVGFVASLADAYRDCHFTIVPIAYGSGTRIKVVESFAIGRRLISTKMGVQGADLDSSDYINVESKEDWIKVLSSISTNDIQENQLQLSRAKMSLKFDEEVVGQKFYDWLSNFS